MTTHQRCASGGATAPFSITGIESHTSRPDWSRRVRRRPLLMPVSAEKTQSRAEQQPDQSAACQIENHRREQHSYDKGETVFIACANDRQDQPHRHHRDQQSDCREETSRRRFLPLRSAAHDLRGASEADRCFRIDDGLAVGTYQIFTEKP
jgi:hypothetical protein